MHETPHEGSCRKNHRFSAKFHLERRLHPLHFIILNQDCCHIPLVEIQTFGSFNGSLDSKLIRLLIALRTRGTDRWPFSCIQHTPLDGGRVGILSHDSSESIDLANHVSLGQSSNCRVTAHLSDRVEILGQHGNGNSETGGSESSLDSGVTGPDDEDVVFFGIAIHGRGRKLATFPTKTSKAKRASKLI